jgi:hypothetical protein
VPVTIQFIFFGAVWQEWFRLITNNISLIGGIMFLVIFILFADRVLLALFYAPFNCRNRFNILSF